MSQNKKSISKSTKRRKFLKDIETVNFLIDHQNNSDFNHLEPNTSQVNNNLIIENNNESVSSNFDTNITSTSISHNSLLFNNLNNVSENDLEYISFTSESDLDDNDLFDVNSILDDRNKISKSLAKWAVDKYITLVAFSALF